MVNLAQNMYDFASRVGADMADVKASAGLGQPTFISVTAAQAWHPINAPISMRVANYAYEKVASQPAHAGKFALTLNDASTVWYEIAERVLDPIMFGADPLGLVDARAAILACETAAQALKRGTRWTGRHLITANTTLSRRVTFEQGASLVVPANVRIGFAGGILAGDYQIFEYANRSSRVYVRNDHVRGYWWGVRMDPVGSPGIKMNNEVELQYALDSVAGYNYSNDPLYPYNWEGGEIGLPAGYCYMQAGVTMHGFTTLKGASRSTVFAPDEAGWKGTTNYLFRMYREATGTISAFNFGASPWFNTTVPHGLSAGDIVFFDTTGALPTGLTAGINYWVITSGLTANTFRISTTPEGSPVAMSGSATGVAAWHKGVSQFNVRLENLRIKGNGFSGVESQVLAWSPQEQCGCYNVHFDQIYKYGLTYAKGFGGATVFEVSQSEFWLDVNCSILAICLNANLTNYTLGWMSLVVHHVTLAGPAVDASAKEWTGIRAEGGVLLEVSGIHGEHLTYEILLAGRACLQGTGLKGGVGSQDIIAVDSFTGSVDVGVALGNAVRLYRDFATPANNVTTDVPFKRLQKGN